MRALAGLTIRQKLTSISVLSSLTALVCATAGLLAYDQHSVRQSLVRRLATDARIIAFNGISPLLFDDAEAANQTLSGLRAEPAVRAAIIVRSDARPFAVYEREPGASRSLAAAPSARQSASFGPDRLVVGTPIRFESRELGTLTIEADLAELAERRRRYALIAAIVLAGSLPLALVVSRAVEKTISRPILGLAAVARTVSRERNYSVRAPAEGRDELAALVATFNEMLDQIEGQNLALEDSRAELERRVEARTRDLAAANQELEAFSYSVSHDLRAPLRAIDGFSKALATNYHAALDERGRHYLDRIVNGTRRMAELIDDLLGLARVSRRELARQAVDVSGIAGTVVAELARRDPQRAVAVEIAPGMDAVADPHLLRIVYENLLGNAWKFTGKRDGARIEVGRAAATEPGPARFFVKDNGAGFDMAYADKLFGAFQRLHDAQDFEGTGIGLATVQRVVARHGGRIWAEGAVGRGATFSFTLEPEP